MKTHWIFILGLYLFISALFFMIRATPDFQTKQQDCVVRYLDYIFPLSRIHCPVNP